MVIPLRFFSVFLFPMPVHSIYRGEEALKITTVIHLIFLDAIGRYNRQHTVWYDDFVCCFNLIHTLLCLTFLLDLPIYLQGQVK